MKGLFKVGDKKTHKKVVETVDLATFGDGILHPVCSTFVLAREIEWASRLFVLEMIEDDEEGIGTKLEINHLSPALVAEELVLEARIKSIAAHEIICNIDVTVDGRFIAKGVTGQKILKKTKIEDLISNIKNYGRKEE